MSNKTSKFTDKQKERLPDEGYLVEILDSKATQYYSITITCIMNGCCKYVRQDILNGNPFLELMEWSTLLWTCVTTRKQLEKNDGIIYHHFKTFEDMINSDVKIPEFVKVKSNNDF